MKTIKFFIVVSTMFSCFCETCEEVIINTSCQENVVTITNNNGGYIVNNSCNVYWSGNISSQNTISIKQSNGRKIKISTQQTLTENNNTVVSTQSAYVLLGRK